MEEKNVNSSETTNELPKKHSSKFLAIVFGGIVILSIGLVAGYFIGKNAAKTNALDTNTIALSPTPAKVVPSSALLIQDTSNWKTYTDSKNNYSFKYPTEWFDPFNVDKPCPTCGGILRGFQVKVIPNSENLSAKDYALKEVAEANKGLPQPTAKILPKPSYFSTFDAAVADSFPGAGSPGLYAFIVKDSVVYTVFFESVDDHTAHTILSTFKFTQQDPSWQILKSFTDSRGETQYIIASAEKNFLKRLYLSDIATKNSNAILVSDISLQWDTPPSISNNAGKKYIVFFSFAGEGVDYLVFDENGQKVPLDLSSMGLGTLIKPQYGITFDKWVDTTTSFILLVNSADGSEYEATFDAATGKQIGKTKQVKPAFNN